MASRIAAIWAAGSEDFRQRGFLFLGGILTDGLGGIQDELLNQGKGIIREAGKGTDEAVTSGGIAGDGRAQDGNSYYKGIESHVQLYDKDLLVYRIDYNEYTGGAHGIYMATFLNMDLTLMRPLRLDDIFVGDYKDALTDLIWNQLMADNKVNTHEALEDMGYASTGDIAPTENFYLSKEGITFYYNVYDITPYSMGPVKVTIPFSMMEHLLGSNPILGELKN